MDNVLRSDQLNNGLLVEFIDCSNRYFGDYHRLRIEVRCRIRITAQHFAAADDSVAESDRVRKRLGDEVVLTRHLERMGVAGDDLTTTRNEMIESFVKSSYPYLQTPEFPKRFIAQELAERQAKNRPFRLLK